MKFYNLFFLPLFLFALISCDSDDDATLSGEPGTVALKFDNIAPSSTSDDNVNLVLLEPGSTTFAYRNDMDQEFNVTVLKYLISEVKLTGPNGEEFINPMEITADDAKGYYLVDQKNLLTSGRFSLSDVPAGTYDQISFTVGVEEEGVAEGAAGGVLSQGNGARDADMFWNWNVGYQAIRMEGFAPASPADGEQVAAFGESVNETDVDGFAFHVGGWANPNNNREVTIEIDPITVAANTAPEIHLVFDVSEFLGGINDIDFSKTFNVHSPTSAEPLANNAARAFKFDHIHN
ncbi:hypothetical protein FNH22_13140 [Fulvivirga sp. M361]|uniref:MbnP family protein n=1 Tax=Fulvivirga sp. M361 TaxID=2594266 RepID=UPI0011799E40|nr:MbnP family protein [Fulvivirga sp. M361]TRX58813.1 hypothetical protein FNH22_13140 [Fulvivirga sp. M361]